MIRFLTIFSSICSLFVLSWGLSRWYGPKNCINSTVVGKVVIVPDNEVLSTCSFEKIMVDPMPNVARDLPNLIKRIEDLEIVSEQTSGSVRPIQINIHKDQAQYLVIQDNMIGISLDLVLEKGLLERSILFSKLENQNPLSSAVIADFLWREIVSRESMPQSRPWLDQVQTIRRYCQSRDILVAHYDFCQIRNSFDDSYITQTDEQPIPWAFVALYSNALRYIYRNSNWVGQRDLLDNLKFLGEIEDTVIDEILISEDPLKANAILEDHLQNWLMPSLVASQVVTDYFKKSSIQKNKNYDLIYVGRGSRNVFPFDFSDYPDSESGVRTAIQTGNKFYFLPGDVPIAFSRAKVFASGIIRNVIYVSCDMPSPEALLDFKDFASKVVFVKQCETDEVDWHEVHRIGLNEYLRQNEDAQFVEFNLSAIILAKRLRGPLKKSEDFTAWQRWLLWQKIVDDDGPSVQRPLSAIDGVGRFRIY